MSHHKKQAHHVRMYRLLAQSAGLLVCGFFMLFIIGEGVPDIAAGRTEELLPFLPFLLLPIAGYVVAWFRELPGTWMMLTGALGLFLYLGLQGNFKAALIYGLPFTITGLLFVLYIRKRRQLQNNIS